MESNKYQNGKIYKIVDIGYNKMYIGSSCEKLASRMSQHRANYRWYKNGKYQKHTVFDLFDEFGLENCKIELIEAYPCKNKEELRRQEGYYIQNTVCVNRHVAGRTQQEYKSNHRDAIRAQRSGKVCCPTCGSVVSRTNVSYHRKSKKHLASLSNTESDSVSSHSSASSSHSVSHAQPFAPDDSELPPSYPS